MTATVAIIGTGEDPETKNAQGYAMAYDHADAYRAHPDAELVACVDIVPENAAAFADAYGLPESGVFGDHAAMLEAVEPDVVSVTTPPSVHAELVLDCAGAGVGAVHCEKPMADTWGDARRMASGCAKAGTQLTFNHQRRFADPFLEADRLVSEGAIGELERVEFEAPNIYDYGTHSIDLCGMIAGEPRAEWVLGGLDYRQENLAFGAHNENQSIVTWRYENGVHGLGSCGLGTVGVHHRFRGSDGTIEVGEFDDAWLRVREGDGDWEYVETGTGIHGGPLIERAVADTVEAYLEGRPAELRAERALNATELIFGAYESVRRRGRVDTPLEIEDNPLVDMVETGALSPAPPE